MKKRPSKPTPGQTAARAYRIRAGHYSLMAAILDPEQAMSNPTRRYRIIPRFRVNPARVVPIFHSMFLLSTFCFLLSSCLCGCSSPRALRGGHAVTIGALTQKLVQSDNPSQPSRQSQETIKVRTYTLPAGTVIKQAESSLQPPAPSRPSSIQNPVSSIPSQIIQHPVASISPPFSVLVTEREETRAATELGAAQKDTAREFGAKLSSLKGIVWVGLVLFIFGLASFAWPPLKTIIGSVTTSAAITLGGVALMILPTLIVGHELLILGAVAASVCGWFLAHRHGHLRGLLSASSSSSSSSAAPKSDEDAPNLGTK